MNSPTRLPSEPPAPSTESWFQAKWHSLTSTAFLLSIPAILLFCFSLFGKAFFLAELTGNFRLQLFMGLFPIAVVLLFSKRRIWGAVVMAIAVWACVGTLSTYLPATQPPPGKDRLRILSFNIWFGNHDLDLVLKRIDQLAPDVIVLNEYTGNWHRDLAVLDDIYPYQIKEPRWDAYGIALFSKRPFLASTIQPLTPDETDNPLLDITIALGDNKLRLLGLHTTSPVRPNRLTTRNRQLMETAETVKRLPAQPTIVVGDFNCTPWSPFLTEFLAVSNLRDSRQGFGYQASWPAHRWPMRIPIDHAFVSKTIHVHDRQIADDAGSDHYPLLIEISIAESEPK